MSEPRVTGRWPCLRRELNASSTSNARWSTSFLYGQEQIISYTSSVIGIIERVCIVIYLRTKKIVLGNRKWGAHLRTASILPMQDVSELCIGMQPFSMKPARTTSAQTHVFSLLSQPRTRFWFSFRRIRLGVRTPEAMHASVVYNAAHVVKLDLVPLLQIQITCL